MVDGDPMRGLWGIICSPGFKIIIPPEKQAVEEPGLIGVVGDHVPDA